MEPRPIKPLPVETDHKVEPVKVPLGVKRGIPPKKRKKKKRGIVKKLKTAMWKAGKKRYSRRRICRGGTKCTI